LERTHGSPASLVPHLSWILTLFLVTLGVRAQLVFAGMARADGAIRGSPVV
jgi:hypothetical protein